MANASESYTYLTRRLKLQREEFEAADRLAVQTRRIRLTAVVDDDWPLVKLAYDNAAEAFLCAAKANRTTEEETTMDNAYKTEVTKLEDLWKAEGCPQNVDLVFGQLDNDGPGGPRFVEAELSGSGRSVSAGEWFTRDDGYRVLRVKLVVPR